MQSNIQNLLLVLYDPMHVRTVPADLIPICMDSVTRVMTHSGRAVRSHIWKACDQ